MNMIVGELCIFNASDLKPQLLAMTEGEGTRTVDLAQVSEVDSAGLQLLLIAKREAARLGKHLLYTNHSEPVLEAARLLGLGAELDDPLADASAGSAR
jgi:anti-sigma B factor antagonist